MTGLELKIDSIAPDKLVGGLGPDACLDFGKSFTDRMLVMRYSEGKGWYDAEIRPYGNLEISPAATVLHYSQEIFEGLKAYYRQDGSIGLFRPADNFKRMNVSAQRICMPQIDIDFVLKALKQLIKLEQGWVPKKAGTALYIRPTMIGVSPLIRMTSAKDFLFYIILSPVGAYYADGFNPVRILVEEEYVRAVPGGVGFAKTGGNYAASLYPAKKASEKGYDQGLWLDAIHHKYIEEVGSMNIFFKFKDKLVTSALNGSILPGITRDSVITVAKKWGVTVEERQISIDEVIAGIGNGDITEVFGSGTAAVISPVGYIGYQGQDHKVGNATTGDFTKKLFDELTGVQYGKVEDTYGWTELVEL